MKNIDLDGLNQCALIYPYTSGVTYMQQCGGIVCHQYFVEGILIPIGYSHELNFEKSLTNRIMSLFLKGQTGDIDGILFEDVMIKIQKLLESNPSTNQIVLDEKKKTSSIESWVFVKVPDNFDDQLCSGKEVEAILTWPNSD